MEKQTESMAPTNAFSAALKERGFNYILRVGDIYWAMRAEPLLVTPDLVSRYRNLFGLEEEISDPSEVSYDWIAPGSYVHI